MRLRRLLVLLGAALAALAGSQSAPASTVFVVTGRGWGHGVGMSQWGAYGLARAGWDHARILAHYYPGTRIVRWPAPRVRVLLAEGAPTATIGCPARLRVTDGGGHARRVRGRAVSVGPALRLPVLGKRAVALAPPLTFGCAGAPLVLNGTAYRGRLTVGVTERKLDVVNVLPLEQYLRGVVAGEMPFRWSSAALEAQAIAARTYTVSQLKPAATFDVFGDVRDQVYGGIAYETRRTDLAVGRTAGRVLTYRGEPIVAYYHSTSGGRTADVRDFFTELEPAPYLVSVPDPFDRASPYHTWGPLVLTPTQLAARSGLGRERPRLRRSRTGRVLSVAGRSGTMTGREFQAALGLRSIWFELGELTLGAPRHVAPFGERLTLTGRALGVAGTMLESRRPDGPWRALEPVRGRFAVRLQPARTTEYRLRSPTASLPPVRIEIAPRAALRVRSVSALAGYVRPRPSAPVVVERWQARRGWRVVAHPSLDPTGRFLTRLRVVAGGYRLRVAPDEALAGTSVRLVVKQRALAARRRQ
jgi:stage II sporulation protein D